nr:PREDICTED: uncharacterized protein LOC109032349 isoform X2 [Bemisia tabaci]
MMLVSIFIFTLTSPLPCMLSDITQPDHEPTSNTQLDLEPTSNTQPDQEPLLNTQPDLKATLKMVAYVHEATLQACGDLGLFPTRMMLHNASMYCWQAFDTLHKLGGEFEKPECRHFFGVPGCRRRGPFRTYKCTVQNTLHR